MGETTDTREEPQERSASLGDFIASQRRAAELSLRQLAERAGISNPYVSQIERGLRKPSAEVLQQLAKALQISAGTLYARAGIIDPEAGQPKSVELAVRNDPRLSESQKQALIEVYLAFTSGSDVPVTPERGTTEPDTPTTGRNHRPQRRSNP